MRTKDMDVEQDTPGSDKLLRWWPLKKNTVTHKYININSGIAVPTAIVRIHEYWLYVHKSPVFTFMILVSSLLIRNPTNCFRRMRWRRNARNILLYFPLTRGELQM